jgi:hypothetical protein
MSNPIIPFGKAKGQSITECTEADLRWTIDVVDAKLCEDPDGRFSDANKAFVAAGMAELERRKNGGALIKPQPAPAVSTPVQQVAPPNQALALMATDPASVTAWFRANRQNYHLVAPSTVVQTLPEGAEVAISVIYVNPDKDGGEVFVTDSGKLALTGTALARISAAAGITWDPKQCGRTDDRRNSRYCEYRAVGGWTLFDGTFITECAHRETDLTDGSDEAASMTPKQLAQQRKFILPLTESKAKNRVIRRLGLKSGYTQQELQKPFAVARLMFTGRTNDPELRKVFAMMKAQQLTAGTAALFGGEQPRQTVAHLLGTPASEEPTTEIVPTTGTDGGNY